MEAGGVASRSGKLGHQDLPANLYHVEGGKTRVAFNGNMRDRIQPRSFVTVEEAVAYRNTSLQVFGVLEGVIDSVAASA